MMFRLFKRKPKPIPQAQSNHLQLISNVKELIVVVMPLLEKMGHIRQQLQENSTKRDPTPQPKPKQHPISKRKFKKSDVRKKRRNTPVHPSKTTDKRPNTIMDVLSLLQNPHLQSLLTPPNSSEEK
jgi:hypothetical protein